MGRTTSYINSIYGLVHIQDDRRMGMKGRVRWNNADGWEELASSGARTRDR